MEVELKSRLKRVRAIFWDIDGTLFSSEAILSSSYQEAFQEFQKQHKSTKKLSIPSIREIMAEIGKPVQEIFQNLAPELSHNEQAQLSLHVLAKLVRSISMGKGQYYEGMPEALHTLHKRAYSFWNASNGRYPYIESILRFSCTFDCFANVLSIDNKNIRDKSELVQANLRQSRLAPEECLLVGDRHTDRDAALANKVGFVAATYGHGAPEEWDKALFKIDSLKQLLTYLP